MRALIVGAGAVGQVYGLHLARGGADVSVFVRGRHLVEARDGYDLIRIHGKRDRPRSRFVPFDALSVADEVRSRAFDQIWLCVPTPALLDGSLSPLFDAIEKGSSRAATIVCLQPGSFVKDRLAKLVPLERVVFGVISMSSFHAPLEGSNEDYELETEPGTAYFFPPGNPNVFSGVGDRAARVVDALRMGDAPARVVDDALRELSFSSALLMPPIAALEAVGWSLRRFRGSMEAALAARAGQEAVAIMAAEQGEEAPLWLPLFRPLVVRMAFGVVGPMVAPFDLEAFLKAHFEKVGAQTRLMFDGYLSEAKRRDLPAEALAELRTRLGD